MKQNHFDYDISSDIQDVISRLQMDLEQFQNKTILITGGTGFFGRWILQTLCTIIQEKGFSISIYVLSRNPKIFLSKHSNFPFQNYIKFIEGDVTDFKLPNIKLDFLIHMATTAAEETFRGEDQLKKMTLLYNGTENTLVNAVTKGVKKVLFTSSGVVYGPSESKYLNEDMLQAPKTTNISSALGEGKRLAEYLVAYYAYKFGFSYSIARCFSFAGQYLPLDIHYAFGNFIKDVENNGKISILGSGREVRSYLYVGDAIVWLLKMLVNSRNQVYNVGSSKDITIADLAKRISKQYGIANEVDIKGGELGQDNFTRNYYVPSTSKIKKELNVSEWTDLDQIIFKMKNHD